MSKEKNKKKLEYLYRMNERIYEQLNFAEVKNGILLGLVATAIGVLVSILVGTVYMPLELKIYLIILTVFFSVSLIACLLSFFPNLKLLKNSLKKNLYFYGYLSSFETVEDYDFSIEGMYAKEKNIEEINSENENKEKTYEEKVHLEAQNIQLSKIIMRKHKCFTVSMHFIFAGLILPVYLGYILIGHIAEDENV